MKLDGNVFTTRTTLMPGVPLCVYGVAGRDFGVIVDTGVASMREQLLELCREVGNVGFVLLTHAHADHIGCNRAVQAATGARFAAAGALPWIEDMETHYREFCLVAEGAANAGATGGPIMAGADAGGGVGAEAGADGGGDLPDSDEQRAEILGLMDGAVHVDVVVGDGARFRLDDDTELVTVALPGHKLEEVAFWNPATGDLFMGDVFLALAAPFFHGFQTARGFRSSLERVERMLADGAVTRVLPAHHEPLDADGAAREVARTRAFLREVEDATVEVAAAGREGGVTFSELWRGVCRALNRQLEFRGYAMLQAQVAELVQEGVLRREGGRIGRA